MLCKRRMMDKLLSFTPTLPDGNQGFKSR